MITEIHYEVTGDCEQTDLRVVYPEEDLEKAKAKKAFWKEDGEIFNVALWKVITTKEIM